MYSNVKHRCTYFKHIFCCSVYVSAFTFITAAKTYCQETISTHSHMHTAHTMSLAFRSKYTASKNFCDSIFNINMLHHVQNAFVRWRQFLNKMIKGTVWALREVRPTAFSANLQLNLIPYSTWTYGHHCPITRQLHALGTEHDTTTTDSNASKMHGCTGMTAALFQDICECVWN